MLQQNPTSGTLWDGGLGAFERVAMTGSVTRTLPLWARPLFLISRPAAILPVATVVAAYFGRYSPEQISSRQGVPLFLQGSTDMGGSDTFSATIAMYVAFGLLAAVYVILQMRFRPRATSYRAELRVNLWELRFHIPVFVIGGTACWDYDSGGAPNDFRNMFFFAVLVYSLSAVFVTALGRWRWPLGVSTVIAPLVVYGWLWLGWDGNTSKAGQVVSSGQDPAFVAPSRRHRVMLAWHHACDRILGDH